MYTSDVLVYFKHAFPHVHQVVQPDVLAMHTVFHDLDRKTNSISD